MVNFKNMKDLELLQLYSHLMEELRSRKVIRSSNNPVADYAEKVAVKKLGLIRVAKEEKGYDAIDSKNKRYQIKGRRITRYSKSRQLGVMRNFDEKPFHYLITVLFNEDFDIKEIWKIPYQFVKENSKHSEHQNGHIFKADYDLLSRGKGVERIR